MKANMTTFKLQSALVFAATISVSNVQTSTITVMNNNDSGPNSLRDAIATARAGDMIQFAAAVTGVITLTSSELLINKSITISGPGANILAVDGNHARRVFHITSGNTVTISGLSITNGNAGNSFGGGIFNDAISGGSATLTLSNCTVSGNRAASIGGGICNVAQNGSATLMMSNCTVSGNSSAFNSGGGICSVSGNNGSVTLTVNNSTFSGNSASFSGGAIVSTPNGSGA